MTGSGSGKGGMGERKGFFLPPFDKTIRTTLCKRRVSEHDGISLYFVRPLGSSRHLSRSVGGCVGACLTSVLDT